MIIKYLKTNIICLISFFIFFNCCYLAAQTASITPWRNDAKAVYSIVHDDYSNYVQGIFQNAYPVATQRGIKLSFGAITGSCGATEWANARTMIAQGGHECINHSHNHKCGECSSGNPNCTTVDYGCEGLTTYTTTNFADELTQSDNIIQQQTGKKARFFIHPYDHHTSEILDYLSNLNYLGSRAGMQGRVNPANFDNPMKLNYFVWGPSGGQETTVAQLNAAVDAAINVGGYTIREFHNVGPGSITNPWGNITVTNYTQHLDYVKSKMNTNQVWSATMSEAITYKMQREVYSPSLTYNAQTGLLMVAFATDLTKLKGISPSLFTPSVFVTPITLKIDVTGISGTISATALQNNVSVSYTRTGNILLLNVFPHNGAVTLNVDVCSADTQKPVFSNCPTNINLSTTAATAIATWTPPSITDNCLPTPIKTSNFESGTTFPIGSTAVVYNATDAKGNSAIPCTFNVVVTQIDPCLADTEKPNFINCPSNIQDTTSGTLKAVIWTPPTATDNCTASPVITSNFIPGSIFPVGSTTVTYNAKDALNNSASPCTFLVIVNKINACETDTLKPIIVNCPTNISLTTMGTTAIATWTLPTATDNCVPTPSVIGNFISGSVFPIGVTTVSYTATDAKGNTAIPCAFSINIVKIDPCATDTIKPVIVNCPANITLTTTGTAAVATWETPTATDNCAPTPEVIWSFTSGTAFPIGVTKVAYDATDAKGNASLPCIFTVTVFKIDPCATDTIKPVIVNCPSNINLTTSGTTAVATWITPTATDNCAPTPTEPSGLTPSVIGNFTSGTAFPIGVTTVTYTATDAKGNTAIPCTFLINVVKIDPCATDTIKPVIVNCPSNINLTTSGTTAVATWSTPTATDNCAPTPSVIGSATSGTAFPIGVTTVTYNSTDAKSNAAMPCAFTVSVLTNPTLRDCEALVVSNNNGAINISGITNLATIQVFSSSWSTVYSATVTSPNVNIPNLSTGDYIVKIALYKVVNSWSFVCEKTFNVTVSVGGGNVCDTDIEKPVFTN
jgi:peptidoglycan/xylan/chitin deacetylase (PgdA/CDA1 family)